MVVRRNMFETFRTFQPPKAEGIMNDKARCRVCCSSPEDRWVIFSALWWTSHILFILNQADTLTLGYLCKCNPLTYFILMSLLQWLHIQMFAWELWNSNCSAVALPRSCCENPFFFYSKEIIKYNNVLHSHSTLGMFRANLNHVEICKTAVWCMQQVTWPGPVCLFLAPPRPLVLLCRGRVGHRVLEGTH